MHATQDGAHGKAFGILTWNGMPQPAVVTAMTLQQIVHHLPKVQ